MATAEQRAEWRSLVKMISDMNSSEPLPREYHSIHFLPNQQEIPAALLEALRAEDGDYESKAEALFKAQMSFEEGCHAQPVLPKFSSHVSDNFFSIMEPAGPDFYGNCKAAVHKNSTVSGNGTRALGSAARLTSGFIDAQYSASIHKQPDFMPIIIVSSAVSSPIQLLNVRTFLERGVYVDPPSLFVDEETGAVNIQDTKPDSVIVAPGSFLDPDKYNVAFTQFRVVDDPKRVKDWSHVCACIVDGKEWQLDDWYPNDAPSARQPSHLFRRIRGYLPYFEEDKVPHAINQWRVQPLHLTRRIMRAHQHILQASIFWEQLYAFLDNHPFFRCYTLPPDE